MPRLTDAERLPMVDAHSGHWTEANTLPGGPLVLALNTTPPSTWSLADLLAAREIYEDKTDEILEFEETTLPALRSERDTLFGANAEDVNGVWYWLMKYKENVQSWLGPKHALSKVVPNLGRVTPGDYQSIIQRFVDHWERVNAAGNAMVLGAMTLAILTQKKDLMEAKNKLIRNAEMSLAVAREEREDLFGDQPDDLREDTSIIAHLLQYHAAIPVKFPGQPIAASLPRIFPDESGPAPFQFNWRDLGGGQLKTWLADPGFVTAIVLFLKEGAVEQTKPFTPGAQGTVTAQTWSGITIVGELDVLELRNDSGHTLAHGNRNTNLAEPA